MKEMNFRPYLLGTVTEAERTALEHSLLTGDDALEQLLLAEDDLIEAYLRQRLSSQEHAQFEQFFLLDPERQQKLHLAQALHRYANDPVKNPPPAVSDQVVWWSWLRHPVWQVTLAGVMLLVAGLGLRNLFPPREPTQIAQHSPSPATTITPVPPVGTIVLPVELFPGQTRAVNSTLPEITLTPNIGTVEFKLLLRQAAYPRYTARLQADDEDGQAVAGSFPVQTTKDGNFVIVPVPVTTLSAGGYRIRLEGVTPNGSERAEVYSFTVKR